MKLYDKSVLTPVGIAALDVVNPKMKLKNRIEFYVVPDSLICLLGLSTSKELGFVTINEEAFIGKVERDQERRDLGDLGSVQLSIDPKVQPRALPCRLIPLALQKKVV